MDQKEVWRASQVGDGLLYVCSDRCLGRLDVYSSAWEDYHRDPDEHVSGDSRAGADKTAHLVLDVREAKRPRHSQAATLPCVSVLPRALRSCEVTYASW